MLIDISRAQGRLNWNKVARSGVVGVIVQVSQGGTSKARSSLQRKRLEYARTNLQGAKDAGIQHRGVYHFAHPRPTERDAFDEAAVFADAYETLRHLLRDCSDPFCPVPFSVLDYELFRDACPNTPEAVGEWIAAFRSKAPTIDTLYTGLKRCDHFPASDLALWCSWYPWGKLQPPAQNTPEGRDKLRDRWAGKKRSTVPWARASLWQYSSSGSVPGIEGSVDLNWVIS
jgi:GH25 family lysozyme M1 (1,4-beta-N-acetylmuramidase)